MKLAMPQFTLPKFSLPSGGGGAAAGLVIRAGEVELLAMKGKSITNRVRVPLEGKDDQSLVQAIQKALGAVALKSKRLAVSISTQEVLFRFFTIPIVPKGEWDAAVQFEARKYIPFKMDTLVWDYRVRPSDAPNRLDVVFAAIQRDAFERIQTVLTAAGVQATLIEPRSLSLARLVDSGKSQSPSNEFVCLVDVEQDTAHLAIVKNGLPYLTRDLNLLMHVELPAAPDAAAPQATPVEGTLPNPQPDVVESATDRRAERLLTELSVSMDFFMREYPSTTIPRVILIGEETRIGPWCRSLADQLHRAVELGHALLGAQVQDTIPLSFASAVGLLRAAQEPGTASLDFLKRTTVKSGSVNVQQRAHALSTAAVSEFSASLRNPKALTVGAVAAGVLLAVFWVAGGQQLSTARMRLNQSKRSQPAIGWGLEAMDETQLQDLQSRAQVQAALLKAIMDQRVSVAAKLDALVRSMPDGVWLTRLSFDNALDGDGRSRARLVIGGACYLREASEELTAIQQFEQQVKRNPKFFSGFVAAQLNQNSAEDPISQHGYRTFELSCHSERGY